jgi:hypothetical protein
LLDDDHSDLVRPVPVPIADDGAATVGTKTEGIDIGALPVLT